MTIPNLLRTCRRSCFAILLLILILSSFQQDCVAQSDERFPFVVPGDDSVPSITDQSHLLHRPAGRNGFVEARDGHFFIGSDRIRFWGVNVCFGANFPEHDVAEKVAAHLAKLGVNSVRFHHMDNQDGPSGIWGGYDKDGKRQFSAEMVDRLDYFLFQLAENGIYSDINLHVSRELSPREGFPVLRDVPWWAGANKYVSYFDPDVQAEWKRYASDLLTHENPYRKCKRVDDPSVALVEMLNEDYFSEQGYALASKLPDRFQKSLTKAWNAWLKRKYESTAAASKAWNEKEVGLGPMIVAASKWNSDLDSWSISREASVLPRQLDVDGPSQSKPGYRALRIAPKSVTKNDYEQQLTRRDLSVAKGHPITLTFWVKADKQRKLRMELSSLAGGEWRELGLFEDFTIEPRWQRIVRVISPRETIGNEAFLAFSYGLDTTAIEFSQIEIQSGSPAGKIPEGQSIESSTVDIPDAGFPAQAHTDMKSFMVETERSWIREFKSYLREIGVRVPITASQINYHAPGIVEEELDFADLHNYWHHPLFPSGKDWNAEEWTVGNNPMEAGPVYSKWPANSLLMRTGWRVSGKPMTMTEWNYSEPSPFSAGCVPMAAMLGALQDWDAIFFFDYEASSERGAFFKTAPNNFFSFNAVPAKLTSLAIFANVFLRGDVHPLTDELVSTPNKPLDGRLALEKRIAVSSAATSSNVPQVSGGTVLKTADGSVIWKVDDVMKRGTVQARMSRTIGVWGTIENQSFEFGALHWEVRSIPRGYGILVATSMDDKSIEASQKIVLLAATNTENAGMRWNSEKNSVGTHWGSGPTMACAIDAKIELPTKWKTVRVSALDGRGLPTKLLQSELKNGVLRFTISRSNETMWYSIEGQ